MLDGWVSDATAGAAAGTPASEETASKLVNIDYNAINYRSPGTVAAASSAVPAGPRRDGWIFRKWHIQQQFPPLPTTNDEEPD